jgi:hypothetical protein
MRLARHPRGESRSRGIRANQLESDVHAEHEGVGDPHDAHPTAAELTDQAVSVSDDLAGKIRIGVHRHGGPL